MDPSTEQHLQEMPKPSLMENMVVCSSKGQQQDRKQATRPQPPEQALKCPRCDSSNTKFCYYNNYSLSQPRYFCKSCRRYWTKGGTLRNVPVGGGCRKNNKRSSSSTSSKRSSQLDQPNITITNPIPPLSYDTNCNDLSLAFARLQKQSSTTGHLGFDDPILGNPSLNLDALRTSFLGNQNQNHFQNFNYYGFGIGNENMGDQLHNGVSTGEMMLPNYNNEEIMSNINPTTTKQELYNSREIWGNLPWQQLSTSTTTTTTTTGDHHHHHHQYHGADNLDHSGRESWNGLNSSNWHGLLNSPLM